MIRKKSPQQQRKKKRSVTTRAAATGGMFSKSDKNWLLNACVGVNGGPYSFGAYAKGYFEAGRRLCTSFIDNPSMIDVGIHACIFICRHGVELALKQLRADLTFLNGDEYKLRVTHSLVQEWMDVERLLLKIDNSKESKKMYVEIRQLIKELGSVDQTGQVFRYPIDVDKRMHLTNIHHINIKHFLNCIDPLITSLEDLLDVVNYWRFVDS